MLFKCNAIQIKVYLVRAFCGCCIICCIKMLQFIQSYTGRIFGQDNNGSYHKCCSFRTTLLGNRAKLCFFRFSFIDLKNKISKMIGYSDCEVRVLEKSENTKYICRIFVFDRFRKLLVLYSVSIALPHSTKCIAVL